MKMFLIRLPFSILLIVYQSAFLALGQIWSNKVRSILTTIGIVIGVASVTAVIAALTGLKTNVLSEFESFGTNKVFIFPRRPDRGPMRNASFRQILFQPDLFDNMLKFCPSLKCFTRQTNLSLPVTFAERGLQDVQISGIEPSWHDIERRTV